MIELLTIALLFTSSIFITGSILLGCKLVRKPVENNK
jgi:hypothetical protein